MTVPTHGKPRHKSTSAKHNIIRWCVGTAMLTATALIISIPLIMRAEDNIQQAANVKAYAATIANTTNTAIQESKRQAKLYNARLANRTEPQTDDPADNSTDNQTKHETPTQNPIEYNQQLVIPPSDVMATINSTQNSESTYPYATEQANKRSPSAPDTGWEHPCRSGEQEPTPSSPHTEASPTNSCSPNSTKPAKAMNSPSPPSVKPSPTKCKPSAPSPPTISLG